MAYRKYIGARYVPLYAGTWDATRNYEPLTIVDDANGNSYTSKRDVPAGTPLTDRTYWIQTSSFSGAVEQLRREMQSAQNDIVALGDRTTENETDIEELKAKDIKRYVIVSDSYGEVSSDFMTRLRNVLGVAPENWFQIARGGYGVNPDYGDYKFVNLLGELTVTGEDTITDVIIAGGFNDRTQTEANLYSGMSDLVTYCKNRFPNAIIHFAAIGWSFNSEHVRDLRGGAYIRTYKRCVELGANYLNGTEYIMRSSDLFIVEPSTTKHLGADYVHPNAEGANRLAAGIAEALLYGKTSTEYIFDNLTVDTSTNTNISEILGSLTFFEKTVDGVTTFARKDYAFAAVYFDTPVTFNGQPIEIGMLRSGVVAGQSPDATHKLISAGTMNGFVGTPSGSVYSACEVIFMYNRLYILPICDRNTQISAIGVYGINITISSDLV